MIDSLLNDLPQRQAIESEKNPPMADASPVRVPESSFLAALQIVQRIVGRRRSGLDTANVPDLVQEIALRLWRWSSNHQAKSDDMSSSEWGAFAARTAYNEIRRYFTNQRIPLTDLNADSHPEIGGSHAQNLSEIEVSSLISQAWQGICNLTVRQRRALLLHSQELVIYLLQSGVSEKELAEWLEIKESEWYRIRDFLPMTDIEIAREISASGRRSVTAASVKKARYEARVKLEGLIGR